MSLFQPSLQPPIKMLSHSFVIFLCNLQKQKVYVKLYAVPSSEPQVGVYNIAECHWLCPQSFLNPEGNAFWNVTFVLGIYCILLHGYEYGEAQFTVLAPAWVSTFLVATGIFGLHVIILIAFLIVCVPFHVTVHISSYFRRYVLTFWRNLVPPSSGYRSGFLWNVCTDQPDFMASHCCRQ